MLGTKNVSGAGSAEVREVGSATIHEVAPVASQEVVIELSRPLPTHHGDVKKIILRKPNYGEFIELGQVENLRFTQATENSPKVMESVIDFERLMRWAVRLSNIDRIILETLDPIDGYKLSKAVIEITNTFVMGNSSSAESS